jgi:hypothetical protein
VCVGSLTSAQATLNYVYTVRSIGDARYFRRSGRDGVGARDRVVLFNSRSSAQVVEISSRES